MTHQSWNLIHAMCALGLHKSKHPATSLRFQEPTKKYWYLAIVSKIFSYKLILVYESKKYPVILYNLAAPSLIKVDSLLRSNINITIPNKNITITILSVDFNHTI